MEIVLRWDIYYCRKFNSWERRRDSKHYSRNSIKSVVCILAFFCKELFHLTENRITVKLNRKKTFSYIFFVNRRKWILKENICKTTQAYLKHINQRRGKNFLNPTFYVLNYGLICRTFQVKYMLLKPGLVKYST